ncbi:nucleotide-binding universal stress UspA family protein [Streptomyces sp. B4I13]|uniref:universal stress protein n=1 Tax=Streptomyces sp. B4I13 TaxID=3042271 RepID=UPI00277EEC07|nr:universal stress protein [Streptomyces sp. B4I13]MDQ0958082.1 nucleotide-binding universal stress UspA family protein [Streptomyces sp. B4I13]
MLRPIVVGLDGSPESLAAADWAAREAQRRGLPLRLVHAWIWQPHDVPVSEDLETQKQWALRTLREAKEDLTARYPDLPVDTGQVSDLAAPVLLDQAEGAEMLVLGSRGHGAIAGFLLGSVGQQVLARAKSPVVMVRANERSAAEPDAGEVVVALQDLGELAEPLREFAFAAAAARGATLRTVHAWQLPPVFGYNPAALHISDEDGGLEGWAARDLDELLKPWREKYPQVPVVQTLDLASASGVVLRAAIGAGLVVVGRKVHRPALGMRIGPVTHAVLHHAAAPVAVVPHD